MSIWFPFNHRRLAGLKETAATATPAGMNHVQHWTAIDEENRQLLHFKKGLVEDASGHIQAENQVHESREVSNSKDMPFFHSATLVCKEKNQHIIACAEMSDYFALLSRTSN